ncbi:MAG TPA: IS5 family transposase [Thermodesulfobacteriota bacterium]|nr:IS5 family transposase [Thermodesulfobacteriota bacterium]
MMQPGLFDRQNRFEKLDKNGDPLVKLNKVVPWNSFRPALETLRAGEKKSTAGAKPYDVVVMFKILILQSLYNLSDEATEYQVLDRLSFMRFLGLRLGSKVPDAKTIWLFREQLTEAGLAEELFRQFETVLGKSGFTAKKGQIIDAGIVQAPKQRNSREETARIKQGEIPQEWEKAKKRQKNTDARWSKKNAKSYYGYKNHINVDVKHKLVRAYSVTDADSNAFDDLLEENNRSADVYADSAYRSKESIGLLEKRGFRERLQRKGCKHRKLTEREQQGNKTRAKIRCRIEHVFGVMTMMAGSLMVKTVGIIRARTKIGLGNLTYNINRYGLLAITG